MNFLRRDEGKHDANLGIQKLKKIKATALSVHAKLHGTLSYSKLCALSHKWLMQCQSIILPGSFSFPVQSPREPAPVPAGQPTDGTQPPCSSSLPTGADQRWDCATRP